MLSQPTGVPFAVSVLLACAACAHGPAPAAPGTDGPAAPTSPASAPTQGATETQPSQASADGSTTREDLKVELDKVNKALADVGGRIETARDATKAELETELAALQRRDDELKARMKEEGQAADATAEKARRKIHRAIVDLGEDIGRLGDRIRQ